MINPDCFRDALKRLRFIDRDQLEAVGIELDDDAWAGFRSDPFYWAMRARDDDFEKLVGIVNARPS